MTVMHIEQKRKLKTVTLSFIWIHMYVDMFLKVWEKISLSYVVSACVIAYHCRVWTPSVLVCQSEGHVKPN